MLQQGYKTSIACVPVADRDAMKSGCWTMALCAYYLVVPCFELVRLTSARKIDSQDLLIGDWNTTLRCTRSWFEAELFPPRILVSSGSPSAKLKEQIRRWEWPRKFQCKLSLYPNGTFGLEPSIEATVSDDTKPQQLLPVHGRWTLDPNPYCVTDRFYDQVVLDLYPRAQKKVVGGREEVLQTVSMQIQCRLSGHFSAGKLRCLRDRSPFYARGKLSHGVLVLDRHTQDEGDRRRGKRRPRIAASFTAKRHIPSKQALESYSDVEGRDEFGY